MLMSEVEEAQSLIYRRRTLSAAYAGIPPIQQITIGDERFNVDRDDLQRFIRTLVEPIEARLRDLGISLEPEVKS